MGPNYAQYFDDEATVTTLHYPVEQFPQKVKSVSFDKVDSIQGTLKGIKGQYLLFSDDRVLNVRKHNGYQLCLET